MADERNESGKERLDRELTELLQGLRVAVTGVQVMFAFLLTVPFSSRFDQTTPVQRWFLYAALVSAALAITFFIAPAAQHRMQFRSGHKGRLVRRSNLYGILGSIALLAAIGTAVLFVMDVLFNSLIAGVTAAVISLAMVWVWIAQPMMTSR